MAVIQQLDEVGRDLRYAARTLVRSPGFTLVSVASTAIAIGLATYMYSVKWKLISSPLPAAANAERLALIEKPVPYFYVEQFHTQREVVDGAAAFMTGVPFNVALSADDGAKPQRIIGQIVSPNYFSVLGVSAVRGRVFDPGLDVVGDAPRVVITDRFWRQRLGASPSAVGGSLRINGLTATIVGITPPQFAGALGINPSELFVSMTAPAAIAPELANDVVHRHYARVFLGIVSVARGMSMEAAEAALDAVSRQLDHGDTSAVARTTRPRVTLLAAGTRVPLPRGARSALATFFVVLLGLIVSIAYLNLANILVTRGVARRKELAVRAAIGASRFRLVRQMLAESVLLSLFGGVAGFAFAYALTKLYPHFRPPTALPVESSFVPDWHVAFFVFCLAALCGVVFGVLPALRVTRADLYTTLRQGSALRLPGHRRLGLRNVLMASQVMGSMMLLLMTGFLVLGIGATTANRLRFDPNGTYLLSLDPVRDGYPPERAADLLERLRTRIGQLPGTNGAALAAQAPLSVEDDGDAATQFIASAARNGSHVQASAMTEQVGARYFDVLGTPVLAGREFEIADQRVPEEGSKTLPVILSATAAHALFGGEPAVGERLRDADGHALEVIGVVDDVHSSTGVVRSVVYLPLTARVFTHPPATGMIVVVRARPGGQAGLLDNIRRTIAGEDSRLSIFNVRTLDDYLVRNRAAQYFATYTYGGIGVFGLLLSAIGLAGVTAYTVARRRREIGIRMALGSTAAGVVRLVLRESAVLVTIGIVLGLAGAFALVQALSSLTTLFTEALRIGTGDARLLIGAPALMGGVVLAACSIPARRAAHIDPVQSIREE